MMSENGINWDEYVCSSNEQSSVASLDLTDYVALFIASLETIFLPIVVIGVFLFGGW